MKKLLAALLAIGMVSTVNAEIYKITTFTKAQQKKVNAELAESSGDSIVFSTNKGPLWVYVEAPAAQVLGNAKVGECYNVIEPNGDHLVATAKKVKCPKKK